MEYHLTKTQYVIMLRELVTALSLISIARKLHMADDWTDPCASVWATWGMQQNFLTQTFGPEN